MNLKHLLLKTIKHKSFQNFLIIGGIAFVQILNNVVLGRKLSKEEFGVYSFVFQNIIRVLSVLLIFGQGATILRFFSSRPLEQYKWKDYYSRFLIILIIPLALVTFGIKSFYNLDWFWTIMIFSGSFFMCNSYLTSFIFRSQAKFNTSVFLDKGHSIVFLAFIGIIYLTKEKITLHNFAILKLISIVWALLFLFYILTKWKQGKQNIDKKVFFEGLTLWELNLTVVVIAQIDTFFIAKLLNYQELALFNIMIAIMQIFEFSRSALFGVYSQKFAKNNNIQIKKFIQAVGVIIILISAFYLISTKFILNILFNGKYNPSYLLVILFTIYGAINLLYVIPSCYLIGQSSKQEMRKMLGLNIVSIIIKVIAIFMLISLKLEGFLIASIIGQGFRTVAGFYIMLKRKHSK